MPKTFSLALALATAVTLSLPASLATAAIEKLDSIAATVDDSVVTVSELNARIRDIKARTKNAGMQLPPENVLREQILDQLINESLQMSAAKRYGVTVSEKEIRAAVLNIMRMNKWTEAQFEEQLNQDGTTFAEFKAQIENQLVMQNLSQGLVRSRIKISEQDIDNFLKSADAKFWISPDYNLSHILVSLSKMKDEPAAEKKATEIYNKLTKGTDFRELALAESHGPMALQGGKMGWRKSTDLPTLFAEIVPSLSKGQISEPFKSRAGFHILKLNDKRGETKQIVNQTKARHILLKTSAILSDDQAEKKLTEIRQSIIDGADFIAQVKEHSEDIGSKLSGGDLGWASPGQFVPAFEKTMAETTEGDISPPFRSQFGWHILQVLERRAEDMTEQAVRAKAKNVLMSRRFEDEVQLWIQEMRDNAFIEIKI